MLVLEPVRAAIWHNLDHYEYENAIFLAERLYDESICDESVFLLATCYFRAGKFNRAYDIFQLRGISGSKNKFLAAKCCIILGRLNEAESILTLSGKLSPLNGNFESEFSDCACFALRLLGKIYSETDRIQLAIKSEQRALSLNPLLWQSFVSLCDMGDNPDALSVFDASKKSSLNQCYGADELLNLANKSLSLNPLMPSSLAMPWIQYTPPIGSISNLSSVNKPPPRIFKRNQNLQSTPDVVSPMPPLNFITPSPCGVQLNQTESREFLNCVDFTPMSELISCSVQNVTGVSSIDYSQDINISSGLHTSQTVRHGGGGLGIMRTKKQLGRIPNFGRLNSSNNNVSIFNGENQNVPLISIKLNFSSPKLSLLTLCQSDLAKGYDPTPQGRQSTSALMPSSAFAKTTNTNQQNITAAPSVSSGAAAAVRRSSRLFGSSSASSVKENTKNMLPPCRSKLSRCSPSRKPRGLSAGRSSSRLDKYKKTKIESIVDKTPNFNHHDIGEDVIMSSNYTSCETANLVASNMKTQALSIQKRSLEGLLVLLRYIGVVYLNVSHHKCKKAISLIDDIPLHHRHSSYILGLRCKAYFELSDYPNAKLYFQQMRQIEPHCVKYMELYSTTLWHLQEEVELSALASELIDIDRFIPETWCVVGNCFSLQKDHENAIKFFLRAKQVDPRFVYAHTLLGHEYMMIEELEKALTSFRTAVRIDPRHYNAWYGIGLTYYKQQRFQVSEIYYHRALSINPSCPILVCHMAVVQHALKRSDKALEMLEIAMKMDSRNPLCKFERASILFSVGRFTESLTELEELKEIIPKESPVYFLMSKVHGKLGNINQALMHHYWAMDLNPKAANAQMKDTLDPNITKEKVATEVVAGEDETSSATLLQPADVLMDVTGSDDL